MKQQRDQEAADRPAALARAPSASGLRADPGPILTPVAPLRTWRLRRLLLQGLGALLSLALLLWCAVLALQRLRSGEVDAQQVLQRAPLAAIELGGLTALSVLLSGLMFWCALLPARRLAPLRVVAVNAVASLAAFLPFKLSAFLRAAIHHRTDNLPFKTLIAWFATVGGMSILTLAPFALASLLFVRATALWWGLAGATLLLAALACPRVAQGLARFAAMRTAFLGALPLLGCQRTVVAQISLRLLDMLAVAARFAIAAQLVGSPIDIPAALALAPIFVLVGSASPAGVLGAREGALAGLATLPLAHGLTPQDVALVSLTVSAIEAGALLLMGVAAAVALRLDRILLAPNAASSSD